MQQPHLKLITENPPIIPGTDFQFLDLRKAIEEKPEPLDFVLPGLPAGTVGSLVASGGTGKSFLVTQLAVTVAGGPDLLNISATDEEWRRSSGKVVFLSGEDPAEILNHRVHALGRYITKTSNREQIYENLFIAPLAGYGIDVMTPQWQQWIKEKVDGARLVIVDTLRRFHTGGENDDAAMATLLRFFEGLCRVLGITIIFLHHTNKSSTWNGAGDAQQASRGSGVITDNARYQSNLVGMGAAEAKIFGIDKSRQRDFVRLTFPKLNYSAPISDRWFRRHEGGILLPAELECQQTSSGQMKTVSEGDDDEQW